MENVLSNPAIERSSRSVADLIATLDQLFRIQNLLTILTHC